MEKKKIEEATFDDFMKVVEAICKCDSCSDCIAYQKNWDGDFPNCTGKNSILYKLIEKFKDFEQPLTTELKPRNLTPDILPYSQTINMMKKKGYKHCYMCGSDLGGK